MPWLLINDILYDLTWLVELRRDSKLFELISYFQVSETLGDKNSSTSLEIGFNIRN